MNEIPIFDCLTHPMPNGEWLDKKYKYKNTISLLLKQMKSENVEWALAVGLGTKVGGYIEQNYPKFISENTDKIFPIAYIDYQYVRDLDNVALFSYLKSLINLGYVGIKLHPRLGGFSFCEHQVVNIIKTAADLELTSLLCTYCWDNSVNSILNSPFSLMGMLNQLNGAPVILLHGGGVLLMQYIEIARAFPNVLLDLSFTLSKYKGSSVDFDIKFAFSQFDKRICIGSDGPCFNATELRERFNYFSQGLSPDKLINIAYRNLFDFLPLVRNC